MDRAAYKAERKLRRARLFSPSEFDTYKMEEHLSKVEQDQSDEDELSNEPERPTATSESEAQKKTSPIPVVPRRRVYMLLSEGENDLSAEARKAFEKIREEVEREDKADQVQDSGEEGDQLERERGGREEAINHSATSDMVFENASPIHSPAILQIDGQEADEDADDDENGIDADRAPIASPPQLRQEKHDDHENDAEEDEEEEDVAVGMKKKKAKGKEVKMIACTYASCRQQHNSRETRRHYSEKHGITCAMPEKDFVNFDITEKLEDKGFKVYKEDPKKGSEGFKDCNLRKWCLFTICAETFDQIERKVKRVNQRLPAECTRIAYVRSEDDVSNHFSRTQKHSRMAIFLGKIKKDNQ